MKIQTTETIHAGPVRVLVYGQQGAGKTSLAKTLKGTTLIASIESGLLSLKGSKIDFVDLTKDDNGVPFPNATAKFNAIVAFLRNPEIQKYDNIVLDSLSQFGNIMKEHVEATEQAAIEKNKFHLWSKIALITTSLINYVNDNMKPNFVFLATEDSKEDDDKRIFYMPEYPGSASMAAIMGLNDEIYRLTVDNAGKRWLCTQPGARFKAKSRGSSDGNIQPIEPADLGSIFERIKTIKPTNKTEEKPNEQKATGPGTNINQVNRTNTGAPGPGATP